MDEEEGRKEAPHLPQGQYYWSSLLLILWRGALLEGLGSCGKACGSCLGETEVL